MELPVSFGKYRLEKFLGGGMSHVFAATDTVLQRPVAVKILTEDGCRDDDSKRRFLSEARMCAGIAHDNIIRVHDYGEQDGRPYIVMELLAGEDLRSAIEKNRTGDLAAKLRIALQAARALKHIHGLNIIHRDIKPDNLHIDDSGRVRLMDFGIAKTENLSLTRTGFAVGTPFYMAPEQVMGKPATTAVDIYAFGIVMYEVLTGIKPVRGETVEALFYVILQQPLDLEPLRKTGVPQGLIDLVAKCGNKKPEDRPANFAAVIEHLERLMAQVDPAWLRPSNTGAPPTMLGEFATAEIPSTARARTRRIPAWAPVAAGVVLIAAFAAGTMYLLRQPAASSTKGGQEQSIAVKPALEPVISDGYGDMVLVPEGKFLAGPDNAEKHLGAFYVDKFEVTVAMWNKFSAEYDRTARTKVPKDFPVTDVTFDEATAYCAWASKRLPTADEWEKAARGPAGHKYPWGKAEDPSRANVKGNTAIAEDQLRPVDSMPEGASPYGALHVAGNAWEWVRQDVRPGNAIRQAMAARMKQFKFAPLTGEDVWFAVRGGGYDFGLEGAVAWEHAAVPARFKSPAIGFRCVREAGQ